MPIAPASDPKHDRPGHFYVTWYDGRNKRRHPEALKTLTSAVDLQVGKAFYLRNRKRAGMTDSTAPVLRLPIRASAEEYLSGLSGCKDTKKHTGTPCASSWLGMPTRAITNSESSSWTRSTRHN